VTSFLGWLGDTLFDPAALVAWMLLGTTWTMFRARDGSRRAAWACVSTTVVVFVMGSPWTANALLGWLEQRARALAACTVEPHGVVVALAGGILGAEHGQRDYERLKDDSLRRLFPAVRLVNARDDTVLLLSGGQGGRQREADLMAGLAQELGVPRRRVVVERESHNTFESARFVAGLLPRITDVHPGHVYLVTSAVHMQRAVSAFRSAGIEVCPVPVDFQYIEVPWTDAVVPQLSAVAKSQHALHEIVGQAVYVLLGRARPWTSADPALSAVDS
jgi:uncharacterized SAM-binding protein YcdF (DUF218 family)